jgi:hypothetical protein
MNWIEARFTSLMVAIGAFICRIGDLFSRKKAKRT